ncbi:DUF1289 domain-containing protein [Shewanella submarina]|uniref:DUF1289 domain-containing protein n=1 Tax=Shewanella submarina TaxID=2016376 RepID=A0ABV7GC37_9GAMM|nr:DUF1289 domain-containing protein [Shewanella submarina]MCL1036753.1 DUF1289 domain-containing protein [Shewanella submarina]
MRSPCVAHCGLNDEDYCMGCFRHIEEIVGWSSSSNEQKQQIIEALPARKARFTGQTNTHKLGRDKWLVTEEKLKS